MDNDAITTLMDLDDGPLGAGYFDDNDGSDFDPHHNHHPGRDPHDRRGPLPFAGFYNAFNGADFDDGDLD